MKILFFVSSMNAGGAERVAATLANAWVDRGDAVTLVPTFLGAPASFYTLDSRVQLLPLASRMSLVERLLKPLGKRRAIRRLAQELRPDVIVSFLTNVNVVVLLATRGLGIPVLVSERTNPVYSDEVQGVLARLRSKTYPWASVVVLQSQQAVEGFTSVVPGVGQMLAIPNPLPPELQQDPPPGTARQSRDAAQEETAVPIGLERRFRLVGMGRLVPGKRFGPLMRSFARLAAQFPEWDLHIWGEGPERDALETLRTELGLDGRIFLNGRTSTPWQELQAADMFVLTSEIEGFPNVLLEAMALGRACVTVDCPSGPREMTDGGKVAHLVPLYDDTALEAALSELMNDAPQRHLLGRHAALHVRQHYGLDHVLDLWDAAFAQAGEAARGNTENQA